MQDLEQLITAIGDSIDHHNDNPKPSNWIAMASDILEKVSRAMPFMDIVGLNGHTILFAAGVAVLAALLLAAIPALRMQLTDLHEGLNKARGARRGSCGGGWGQTWWWWSWRWRWCC